MVTRTILAHAAAGPERPAVIHNGASVSYGDFARMITLTGRYLAAQGLPGSGVAVLLIANRLDGWVIGHALRAMGLDTVNARHVDDIARLQLRDIACVVATGAEDWAGLEQACGAQGWRFVRLPRGFGEAAGAFPDPRQAPGGHILLTSATTGDYKKVRIAPETEAGLNRRRQAAFGIGADSTVLLFDFGGWTGTGYKVAAATWDAGGCVALHRGPRRHEALLAGDLTHAFIVPQMLENLLAAPEGAFPRRESMGLYVTGGPLTGAAAEASLARITGRLFTHVGSTETSTFALTQVFEPEDRRWHRIIPGSRVSVVGEAGEVLAPGEEGRLRIGLEPDGVTGYLDDPETTAAFFRDGCFYPGDLAVMREDGRFALLGRVTDVINVLGSKLPAGPIEDALRERLGVTGACVLSMQDDAGEEQLHVAIETPAPIEIGRLTDALKDMSFAFAKAHIHFMPTLPRNHMGKIERLVLTNRFKGGPAA